ncbi:hypothetical protein CDAR_2611 [Caerostris darwini]|uniref:Uncharacterized protein n=1 Tax=Caerostris darwini TaxID=1538125 RepID=A0AAV4N1Z3_9ARAC|nr:hypothetical protein CDAR_2611 [Caerostris darwini]
MAPRQGNRGNTRPAPLGGHAKKMNGVANSKPDISTRSTRQKHPAHAPSERPSTAPPQWDETKRQFIKKQNVTKAKFYKVYKCISKKQNGYMRKNKSIQKFYMVRKNKNLKRKKRVAEEVLSVRQKKGSSCGIGLHCRRDHVSRQG